MKRFFCAILVIIFSLAIPGCSTDSSVAEAPSDFFIWTDGYIALAEGQEQNVAFTYYYDESLPHIIPEEVERVYFPDATNSLEVLSWEIDDASSASEKKYSAYALKLTLCFSSQRIQELKTIGFRFKDQTQQEYPLGTWVFDVGEPPGEYSIEEIDIWRGSAATSRPHTYTYYYPLGPEVRLTKLYYWADTFIEDDAGLNEKGGVSLAQSNAPVRVVQPKLEISSGTDVKLVYGTICWCGALDLSEDEIDMSLKYTQDIREAKEK